MSLRTTPGLGAAVLGVCALLGGAAPAAAAPAGPYAPTTVLVGFRAGVGSARRAALTRLVSGRLTRSLDPPTAPSAARALVDRLGSAEAIGVAPGQVPAAVQTLRHLTRWVRYAEPDYLMRASGVRTPNDPSFDLQWGSLNTGQDVEGISGTAGADDSAARAWNVSTGSRSVVIGEVDTGVDYTHPDLAANIWSNPGGVGGCPAGTHGYNVLTSTCDPMDDDTYYGGHGTHVAGIMGAVGNNGVGVAGIDWATTILPVKWLDSNASGTTSGLIAALNWLLAAKQAGVNIRVVNDSATFEGTAYSQALSDEIDQLGAAGILFVTAAGNTGEDDDNPATVRYPCSYDRPTEICVTASDQNDQLPSWANHGPQSVDLAAPGEDIYSTLRNGTYGYISGGSMAAAQVSGAAALILSVVNATPAALKLDILGDVDPLTSLTGAVRTGGRLDICAALPGCVVPAPATFGYTSLGGSTDTFMPDRKRVSAYTVPKAGSLSKLSIYLSSAATSGQAQIEGVVYADSGGAPGALLGTTGQLTFAAGTAAGWRDLTFAKPVSIAAGKYWIGVITGGAAVAAFRYKSVAGVRDYNTNAYASGPSNPFGAASTDNEQTSLYATYTPAPSPPRPVSTSPYPAISGTAEVGDMLSATTGSWLGSPISYTYQWWRCTGQGNGCVSIAGATTSTYVARPQDSSSTLRVSAKASNSGGTSAAAVSAATAPVT